MNFPEIKVTTFYGRKNNCTDNIRIRPVPDQSDDSELEDEGENIDDPTYVPVTRANNKVSMILIKIYSNARFPITLARKYFLMDHTTVAVLMRIVIQMQRMRKLLTFHIRHLLSRGELQQLKLRIQFRHGWILFRRQPK